MPAIVVFVDCLGDDEAGMFQCFADQAQGRVNSGIPRVTPQVVSTALTGCTPIDHGLLNPLSITRPQQGKYSTYTKHNPAITRPKKETIIEKWAEEYRVLNLEIPMTMNLKGKKLTNIGSSVGGVQQQRPAELNFSRPQGNLWGGEEAKTVDGFIDHIRQVCGSVRNLIRNGVFDIVFLSIRELDSLGHFLYPEHRYRLAEWIDIELEEMSKMNAPTMFFSDHGITQKVHTFYLNRWLIENGWLNVDIFWPGFEASQASETDPMTVIGPHSNFVNIRPESHAVSTDPFDSGIQILRDDTDVGLLRRQLMETGFYNGIYTPEELWGEGENRESLGVDLVCDRADGILVTGNLHPALTSCVDADNYCQGNIRTGVHSRHGCYGANVELSTKGQDLEPQQLYGVMNEFLNRSGLEGREEQQSIENAFGLAEQLEALGYD